MFMRYEINDLYNNACVRLLCVYFLVVLMRLQVVQQFEDLEAEVTNP